MEGPNLPGAADFILVRSDPSSSGAGEPTGAAVASRSAEVPGRIRSNLSCFAPLSASGRTTSFDVDLAEARRITSTGLPQFGGPDTRVGNPETRVPSQDRRYSPTSQRRSLSPGRCFSSSRRQTPSPRRQLPPPTSWGSTGGHGLINACARAGFVRGQQFLLLGTHQPSSFLPPQYRRPRSVHEGTLLFTLLAPPVCPNFSFSV